MIMYRDSLVTLPNAQGNRNSFTFIIYAGTTMIRFASERNIVSAYDFKQSSYIQYIDLNAKKVIGLHSNNVVDLKEVENLNKIEKMASFTENWNGTGGSIFSENAIILFEKVIKALKKQPQIAPTGRNSLLMQYELDDKSMLAFEVSEKGTEKVYIPKGDYSLAQMEVFTEDIERKINECVEKFFYGYEQN